MNVAVKPLEDVVWRRLNEENGCSGCKYYAELKEPREVEVNVKIHGYCFKSPYNMGKGFPVYLPDGSCKDRKCRRTSTTKGSENRV